MAAEVYTVSKLAIAPLKSGGLYEVDKAWLAPEGLETVDGIMKDHEYFAVRAKADANGVFHFVTQRSHEVPDKPNARKEHFRSLALVKPTIERHGQVWGWENKANQQVDVSKRDDEGEVRKIKLWDFEGEAVEIPHLTSWLHDVSGYDLRVMRTAGPWKRPVRQNYVQNPYFMRAPDGYPIHAISEEEVKAVSEHAGAEIPWTRYRPQIVLAGGEAWSLHEIYTGEINGVEATQTKPCGRCPIPGFDQELGIPSKLKPLAHIDAMRPRWINIDGEEEVIFGENWIVDGGVIVQIGDEFKPTSYRKAPNPVLQFATR